MEKIDVDVFDPSGKIRTPYWLLPGGGIELGETPEQAVAREIHEECGLDHLDIGPIVWFCEHVLVIGGTPIQSRDHYILARTADSRVVTNGMEQYEREIHCEHRWWQISEIKTSTEIFAPPNLGNLMEDLLINGTTDKRIVNIPW